jgi:hypothetical protein
VALMGERRDAYRVLVGKPEGKRPLWIPKGRWEDNIEKDLQKKMGDVDWIDLIQDRDRGQAIVKKVMKSGCHKIRGISWVAE